MCSTLLYPASLLSPQKPKYQYRDHLVGQLTTDFETQNWCFSLWRTKLAVISDLKQPREQFLWTLIFSQTFYFWNSFWKTLWIIPDLCTSRLVDWPDWAPVTGSEVIYRGGPDWPHVHRRPPWLLINTPVEVAPPPLRTKITAIYVGEDNSATPAHRRVALWVGCRGAEGEDEDRFYESWCGNCNMRDDLILATNLATQTYLPAHQPRCHLPTYLPSYLPQGGHPYRKSSEPMDILHTPIP